MNSRKYTLNQKETNQVDEFVHPVHEERQSRDKRNNDTGRHRIIREKTGKIGEVAASKFYGGTVSFEIWKTGTFGHTPDLTDPDAFVKACSIEEAENYGLSWLFNKNDPIVISPETVKEPIILTVSNHLAYEAIILGHLYAIDLIDKFGPCRSKKLAHKWAVWFNGYRGIKDLIKQNY